MNEQQKFVAMCAVALTLLVSGCAINGPNRPSIETLANVARGVCDAMAESSCSQMAMATRASLAIMGPEKTNAHESQANVPQIATQNGDTATVITVPDDGERRVITVSDDGHGQTVRIEKNGRNSDSPKETPAILIAPQKQPSVPRPASVGNRIMNILLPFTNAFIPHQS